MSLFLPSRWVYVWYEDGKMENVANSDTLTLEEAECFRDMWEKARKKKVVRVTLETQNGDTLKSFTY